MIEIPDKRTDKVIKYNLYALCSHSGTLSSGHYTAFTRLYNPKTNTNTTEAAQDMEQGAKNTNTRWFYITDSYYSEVEEKTVLSATREAYILFYEQDV